MPARPGEPAGSESAADSETVSGTIAYTAPDGVQSVSIDGIPITAVGQVITTATGIFTITSIADGAIGYSFTLIDNTTDGALPKCSRSS